MEANKTATPAVEVGKVYKVVSSRKGKFTMRVTHVDDTFISGVITDGAAGAIMNYNVRETGEEVTVRTSLCFFTPVDDAALAKASGGTA